MKIPSHIWHDIRSLTYPRYGYPWCPRPSTQALLYLAPSKYLFLPSSRAHLGQITFIDRRAGVSRRGMTV